MDRFKTSMIIKCVGPGLVMAGVTSTLIRILFSYKPTCFIKGRKRHQNRKEMKDFGDVENIDTSEEIRTVSNCVRRKENVSQGEAV